MNIHHPGEYEKMFVINNHEKMSAAKMAIVLKMSVTWVNRFCRYMKIEPARKSFKVNNIEIVRAVIEEIEETPEWVRPIGVYSNHSPYGIADELMKL